MAYAGRYAQGVELNIGGHTTTYWGLRKHPMLIKFVSDQAGVTRDTVLAYLNKSFIEREQLRHEPGYARKMEEALDKAEWQNGVLTLLQNKFIKDSPNEWQIAMMEAGYSYRGSENINNSMRNQIRAGATLPEIPYEDLYRRQVVYQ